MKNPKLKNLDKNSTDKYYRSDEVSVIPAPVVPRRKGGKLTTQKRLSHLDTNSTDKYYRSKEEASREMGTVATAPGQPTARPQLTHGDSSYFEIEKADDIRAVIDEVCQALLLGEPRITIATGPGLRMATRTQLELQATREVITDDHVHRVLFTPLTPQITKATKAKAEVKAPAATPKEPAVETPAPTPEAALAPGAKPLSPPVEPAPVKEASDDDNDFAQQE